MLRIFVLIGLVLRKTKMRDMRVRLYCANHPIRYGLAKGFPMLSFYVCIPKNLNSKDLPLSEFERRLSA